MRTRRENDDGQHDVKKFSLSKLGTSDRKLVEAIAKVDGVDYQRSHGVRKFFGVGWRHDDDRDDVEGEILSSADYRPD